MEKKPLVVAGIPAFNEEEKIAKVIVKTKRLVDLVIICDDGSKDATGEIARQLGVKVVVHERNVGYGGALATLFREATAQHADVFVTLDGDGQHNPEDIPILVEPIIRGEVDIVIGSRFLAAGQESGAPGYRQAGIKVITSIANRASHSSVTDAQSGFRAYNRKALYSIKPSEMGMGASTEILMQADELRLTVGEVPVRIAYEDNSSTHNPVYQGVDVVFSTIKHMSIRHPLMSYGIPGFGLLLVALGFWIWTFEIFSASGHIVTNITLFALGSSIIGAILLMTGVLLWVLISVVKADY